MGRHRPYNRDDGDLNHLRQTTDNFTHHRQTETGRQVGRHRPYNSADRDLSCLRPTVYNFTHQPETERQTETSRQVNSHTTALMGTSTI